MKRFELRKRSGGVRVIYAVNKQERAVLRPIASRLAAKVKRADTRNAIHGCLHGRSVITAAQVHVGHRYTISFDLADFFDTVTPAMVAGKLTKEEEAVVFVDGAPRQGLPTSPAVANLAALALDKAVSKWIEKAGKNVVYTRYVDDLTFSCDEWETVLDLKKQVPQIVRRCGFKLNLKKTHVQDAKHGRRHICGVAVDDEGVKPTRQTKRRARAAAHNLQKAAEAARPEAELTKLWQKWQGLCEWMACKPPRQRSRSVGEEVGDELDRLSKVWGVKLPHELPDKEPDVVDGDFLITGDPVYMAGMSTWTTGWKSCMGFPNGQFRRKVTFWMKLQGTRIAAILHPERVVEIGGVKRRAMAARALLHTLRNGEVVYDRLYGNDQAIEQLRAWLHTQGAKPVSQAKRDVAVVGNVRGVSKPYMDSLKAVKVKLKNGKTAIIAKTK